MADELKLHNYVAADNIKAGQFVALDVTNSVAEKPMATVADTTNTIIIGCSAKDVNAGEAITYHSFESGSIFPVMAGGAISAGDQLGVDGDGLAQAAGSGYVAVPVFAMTAATASGDVILGVVAHPGEVET